MNIWARIIADSLNTSTGDRLTTMLVKLPRIVLAEFNTHRAFWLAGDSMLEFDLPAGTANGYRRIHHMRLDDFVDDPSSPTPL